MSNSAIFWLVLTIVLGIVEAATPTLVCIWPAASALITCVLASLGAPLWLQIVVFVAITVVLLILTKPLVKKYVAKKTVATNADRIIGSEGIVIHEIDPIDNMGQVKVMGQVWSAKAENNEILPIGTHVTIKKLEGVKVVVTKINNQ